MNSPLEVTNYKRTQAELEAFWLFCLFVAGRNSDFGYDCMRRVINSLNKGGRLLKTGKTPFEFIRQEQEWNINFIHNLLVANKVGQYTRYSRAINESLNLNLRTATLEELMDVYGIGPKTARFFLVHSRGELEYAILDVHILRWLRQFYPNAPEATPINHDEYKRWEEKFLLVAKSQFPNAKDTAEIDLLLWAGMSGRL